MHISSRKVTIAFLYAGTLVSMVLLASKGTTLGGNTVSGTLTFCEDSDEGDDPYRRGVTTVWRTDGISTPAEDRCGGKTLTEFSCDEDGMVRRERLRCRHGCREGACVRTPRYVCGDSDGGIRPWNAGTVTEIRRGMTRLHRDRCVHWTLLEEYSCNPFRVVSKEISCPRGCRDGRCIEQSIITPD